jgi:hypothetical protein
MKIRKGLWLARRLDGASWQFTQENVMSVCCMKPEYRAAHVNTPAHTY